MSSEAAIAGLREQIIANAALLYPDSVAKFQLLEPGRHVPPAEVFHVVVTRLPKTGSFGAFMRHKHSVSQTVNGEVRDSIPEALSSLLHVMATKLGEKLRGGGGGAF